MIYEYEYSVSFVQQTQTIKVYYIIFYIVFGTFGRFIPLWQTN